MLARVNVTYTSAKDDDISRTIQKLMRLQIFLLSLSLFLFMSDYVEFISEKLTINRTAISHNFHSTRELSEQLKELCFQLAREAQRMMTTTMSRQERTQHTANEECSRVKQKKWRARKNQTL